MFHVAVGIVEQVSRFHRPHRMPGAFYAKGVVWADVNWTTGAFRSRILHFKEFDQCHSSQMLVALMLCLWFLYRQTFKHTKKRLSADTVGEEALLNPYLVIQPELSVWPQHQRALYLYQIRQTGYFVSRMSQRH